MGYPGREDEGPSPLEERGKDVFEVLVFLDLPAYLNTRPIGKNHIQQDQVRTICACCLEAFFPRGGLQHFVPCSPEDQGSQREKLGVIINNEYFGLIIYFLPPIESL